MTGRKRFLALAAVALVTACGDRDLTDPQYEPHLGPPVYAIAGGAYGAAHNSGASSLLNITAPARSAGDVLVAQIVVPRLNGAAMAIPHVICPPAGWVSIRRTDNREGTETSDVTQETFLFVATSSSAAATQTWRFRTYSCTSPTTVNVAASGSIIRFSGVDNDNPIEVHDGNAGTADAELATPNVTTTSDSARVLRYVAAGAATQVAFTGIQTLYSGSSSVGAPRTFSAGQFTQFLADSTGAGAFTFGAGGAGPWVGQTIALRPASDLKPLLRDRFSRVVEGGWGTASIGGPWFANVNGGNFLVDGSSGVAVISSPIVHNVVGRDTLTYGLNVTGITSFAVDRVADGGPGKFHTVQVYARRNDRGIDGNNYYRFRVRILGSGVMDMRLEKSVDGIRTWLDAVPVRLTAKFTPGAKYWLRWEAFGTSPATTLRMKAWKDGEPEPATWPASAVVDEPALDLPGTTGYRFEVGTYQTGWPVTFSVDDLVFSEILR